MVDSFAREHLSCWNNPLVPFSNRPFLAGFVYASINYIPRQTIWKARSELVINYVNIHAWLVFFIWGVGVVVDRSFAIVAFSKVLHNSHDDLCS